MELKRDNSAFLNIFEQVNEINDKENTIFSHLIVDGTEVYENHELYINEKLNEIQQVEIITKSVITLTRETMESIYDYLDRAIPALHALVDDSFDSFDGETWEGINQLAEGMQWILQFTTFVKGEKLKPTQWIDIEKSITQCETNFKQLMEGVEAEDTVLISDILSYEIAPAYEELKGTIEKSLKNEEFFKDAH